MSSFSFSCQPSATWSDIVRQQCGQQCRTLLPFLSSFMFILHLFATVSCTCASTQNVHSGWYIFTLTTAMPMSEFFILLSCCLIILSFFSCISILPVSWWAAFSLLMSLSVADVHAVFTCYTESMSIQPCYSGNAAYILFSFSVLLLQSG